MKERLYLFDTTLRARPPAGAGAEDGQSEKAVARTGREP